MTGVLEAAVYFVPVVVGYYAVDRALARYYTGSWWGQPTDVEADDG